MLRRASGKAADEAARLRRMLFPKPLLPPGHMLSGGKGLQELAACPLLPSAAVASSGCTVMAVCGGDAAMQAAAEASRTAEEDAESRSPSPSPSEAPANADDPGGGVVCGSAAAIDAACSASRQASA